MRIVHFRSWLPALALGLGILASAIAAQETSEEESSSDRKERAPKITATVHGHALFKDESGAVRVLRLKKGEGGKLMWQSETQEESGEASGEEVRKRIAILVGPEGQKQEVVLNSDLAIAGEPFYFKMGEGDQEGSFRVFGHRGENGEWSLEPGMIAGLAQMSGYMIGVSCESVGETLASQLGIEKGLVVQSVSDDSPASGKLEVHDVITHANGEEIGEIDALIKAVQTAGEAEKNLDLAVLRGGKKVEVSVTPRKRETAEMQKVEGVDLENLKDKIKLKDGIVLESIGPGVFNWSGPPGAFGQGQSHDELKAEIEALRKQIEELSSRLGDDK